MNWRGVRVVKRPIFFPLKMMLKLLEVYSQRTRGSNFKSLKSEAVASFRVTDSTAITVGILVSRVMPAHSGFDEVLSALFYLQSSINVSV